MLLARSLIATVAAAGIAVPFVLPGPKLPSVAVTDPVNEIWGEAMLTYKPAIATPVQDVWPQVTQRGVQLDGMLRSGAHLPFHINANPYESAWRAPSVGGIRLDTGTFQVSDVDIALPSEGFEWVIGRTYNARQLDGSSAYRNSNSYQGKNWHQSSQPEIHFYDDATNVKDLVILVFGADRFVEYKRVASTGTSFKGTNGAAGIFEFAEDAGGADTYKLTDQHGYEFTFFGFDAGVASGQLWKIADPDGNTAYVGDSSTKATAITSGYDASGRIQKAYDSSDRRYTYTYTNLDSVVRLTEVKAETKTGGTWASPTGLATVAEVDYAYYTSETYGDAGDLKTVTVTTPLTDSGVSLTQKRYYRYWEGTYDATTNPGYPHALQYVVDFEGVRRFDWSDSTFDDDHLTASETSLKPYASAFFKYDSSHRVKEAWFNGDCGCSGANNGTYAFEYESNGSYSDTANTYDQTWCTRTVVQRPDTSYLTQYWDEVGQPLSQVITDADPDNTSPAPNRWATRVTRNTDGFVLLVATPANCSSYTHSTGTISGSSSAGLIWDYTRATNGSVKNFVTKKMFKEGTSGTLYYDKEFEYEQASKIMQSGQAGETHVIRPTLDKVHTYQAKSTSTADRITTDYTHAAHSGTVALSKNAAADPIITSSKNGSNSANSETPNYRLDATPSFEVAKDGVVTYREYTKGQLTELIEDADTDVTGDFDVGLPSGVSSPDGYHRKTTYSYDAQGRVDVVTAPDGQKTKHYYTKLADGRSVELVYADYETTPKFYGPVEYTVTNQAGEVEAQATVALTSNESTTALTGHLDETDSDPITAMDLGTVVRHSTSHYNESGHTLEESRLYFDVPTSGAGSDGTNYDATFFGYDDNGRRVRTKAPHGTITRTVYDIHGRTTGRFVGTNDHDFSGGETTGTDNMVQVEALEYDGGGDDGNGHLTSRTAYVVDGTTGQRVTTYAHDARGRVLLQTNPTAPHAFHKYDNEGRTIATALLSSTSGVTVGTTDPVSSEITERMALTETYYDEIGQPWKTVRHKINPSGVSPSGGDSEDTLESLTWRDKMGRTLKEDGSQLAKSAYDRLGRTTHRFVLAEDNDSAYGDVDDVTGDYVLEEHQTVYESEDSDEVVLSVRIDRTHDDWGTGSTTGALDSNADSGDRLLITAANLSGRAQISASWYDRFGRVTDRAEYGTNGGSNFDRDGLSVPSRSDTVLVTSYTYDPAQGYTETTDPRGLVARVVVDDAGRTTSEVRNYSSGVNSGNPASPDDNQTVRYEYVDGLRTKIIADMPSGESDQETVYFHGTTAGTPAGQVLSTGDRIRAVKYPDSTNTGTTTANIDSDSSDVVSYAYNAQGQEVYRKDQAGNVYESDYDTSGRRTHERVTTLASGFDGAVRRKSWTYDSLGRSSLVSQYDNATVGSGSVTDEVSYTYDGWGGITSYKQDKDSAVGGSGYYEMAYAYAKATTGRNTIRRSSMTLPGGKVIAIEYTKDKDDSISRVSRLTATVLLARYDYLGAGRVVATEYGQPNVAQRQYDLATESYDNYLDRFNRLVKNTWTTEAPATDRHFYDCDISYDRNSNITWVEDNTHAGFDVKYTMDDLDRLVDAEEGTRSGSSITSRTRQQTWTTLDHVGNWDVSKLDLNGDGDFTDTDELNETRVNNTVNELSSRDTDSNGTPNFTLAYDAAGNMTDDGEDYEYEYDAFYRLRKVKNQSSTLLAEYRYNGLGHMIEIHEDTDASETVDNSDVWFHPAYDEGWRTVATFRSYWNGSSRVSDSSPKEQFVNAMAGLDGYGRSSYINDVVCRERDNTGGWLAASDGTLEERYFYCPNWRGDVSVLVHSGRYMAEWVKYSAYGVPFGLPGGDTNSDGDNDAADATQIQTWINASAYDVRGDVDLDGDVDSTDRTLAQGAPIGGCVLGHALLSNEALMGRVGFSGYHRSIQVWVVRQRTLSSSLGLWLSRDPEGYLDGANLSGYVLAAPIRLVDPTGGYAQCTTCELEVDVFVHQTPGRGGSCKIDASLGAPAPGDMENGKCSFLGLSSCRQTDACKANITIDYSSPCGGYYFGSEEPYPKLVLSFPRGGNTPLDTQGHVRIPRTVDCGKALYVGITMIAPGGAHTDIDVWVRCLSCVKSKPIIGDHFPE